jgi:hypothetical protein
MREHRNACDRIRVRRNYPRKARGHGDARRPQRVTTRPGHRQSQATAKSLKHRSSDHSRARPTRRHCTRRQVHPAGESMRGCLPSPREAGRAGDRCPPGGMRSEDLIHVPPSRPSVKTFSRRYDDGGFREYEKADLRAAGCPILDRSQVGARRLRSTGGQPCRRRRAGVSLSHGRCGSGRSQACCMPAECGCLGGSYPCSELENVASLRRFSVAGGCGVLATVDTRRRADRRLSAVMRSAGCTRRRWPGCRARERCSW